MKTKAKGARYQSGDRVVAHIKGRAVTGVIRDVSRIGINTVYGVTVSGYYFPNIMASQMRLISRKK